MLDSGEHSLLVSLYEFMSMELTVGMEGSKASMATHRETAGV